MGVQVQQQLIEKILDGRLKETCEYLKEPMPAAAASAEEDDFNRQVEELDPADDEKVSDMMRQLQEQRRQLDMKMDLLLKRQQNVAQNQAMYSS